jgi:hypothetical protein
LLRTLISLLVLLTAPAAAQPACDVASLEVTLDSGLAVGPTAWKVAGGHSARLVVTATASDGSRADVTSAATYSPTGANASVDATGELTFATPGTRTFDAVTVEYCGRRTAVFFEILVP